MDNFKSFLVQEIGGNLWESGDKKRIYFSKDAVLKMAGYKVTVYGTGNISSASFRGEKISNSEGTRAVSSVSGLKFFYDLVNKKFNQSNFEESDVFGLFIEAIEEKYKQKKIDDK